MEYCPGVKINNAAALDAQVRRHGSCIVGKRTVLSVERDTRR